MRIFGKNIINNEAHENDKNKYVKKNASKIWLADRKFEN
jgi:hypothetical protein